MHNNQQKAGFFCSRHLALLAARKRCAKSACRTHARPPPPLTDCRPPQGVNPRANDWSDQKPVSGLSTLGVFALLDANEKATESTSGSRGALGARARAPPLPPRFLSKSCSFQGILRGKPLFLANFGLRAPLGIKTPLAPLTNILDPAPGIQRLDAQRVGHSSFGSKDVGREVHRQRSW